MATLNFRPFKKDMKALGEMLPKRRNFLIKRALETDFGKLAMPYGKTISQFGIVLGIKYIPQFEKDVLDSGYRKSDVARIKVHLHLKAEKKRKKQQTDNDYDDMDVGQYFL